MRVATMSGLLFAWVMAACAAHADPNPLSFEDWKTDFSVRSVELSEIRSGGPPRDGIPAIDAPAFVSAGEATGLSARDPVVALSVDGEARAYPLNVLMWHEIVNDRFGDRQVTVTYCPLCNSAVAFEAAAGDRRLDFGTTGRLRNSDLVMYDRQTESWWQQFTGEAIIGELTGTRLKMLPAGTIAWQTFRERHPDGKVLVPSDPASRRYGQNPYRGYDSGSRPFLYSGDLPQGIAPMERVVVVRDGDAPYVVTLRHVREHGPLATGGFVISWQEGMASALDAATIAEGREVGAVSVTRQADGAPIVHDVTFAFVAHAFHPEVPIEGKAATGTR